MGVVSIQSQVCYGHVGNTAAAFILRLSGHDVHEVPTTILSNTPHYPSIAGEHLAPSLVRSLLDGLLLRLAEDGGGLTVLTGYLATAQIAEAVADWFEPCRRRSDVLLCCDPVLGDGNRYYVEPEIAHIYRRRLLPLADIATPNQFELQALTGIPVPCEAEAWRAIGALHALGPRTVVATGLSLDETPSGSLDILVSDRGRQAAIRVERIAIDRSGTGDVFAARYLGQVLAGHDGVVAAAQAAEFVATVLRQTMAEDARELCLPAAAKLMASAVPTSVQIFPKGALR